jgi:hypothetical protein
MVNNGFLNLWGSSHRAMAAPPSSWAPSRFWPLPDRRLTTQEAPALHGHHQPPTPRGRFWHYRSVVVENRKPAPPAAEDVLEAMQRETDTILAASAKLVREMEELIETSRQLRAAQAALLAQRRKNKGGT